MSAITVTSNHRRSDFRPQRQQRRKRPKTTCPADLKPAQQLLLELEAGALIALAPSCPRWASRRVDQLTLRHDALLGVEVVL